MWWPNRYFGEKRITVGQALQVGAHSIDGENSPLIWNTDVCAEIDCSVFRTAQHKCQASTHQVEVLLMSDTALRYKCFRKTMDDGSVVAVKPANVWRRHEQHCFTLVTALRGCVVWNDVKFVNLGSVLRTAQHKYESSIHLAVVLLNH